MNQRLKRFVGNERGAVTVDWVVICAGMIALVIAATTTISSATLNSADDTSNTISTTLD